MIAAIYARYSSDKQREASLEDQERTCRRRAEQEGWTVVKVYGDAAISGSRADRPGYAAMLAALEQAEADRAIVANQIATSDPSALVLTLPGDLDALFKGQIAALETELARDPVTASSRRRKWCRRCSTRMLTRRRTWRAGGT